MDGKVRKSARASSIYYRNGTFFVTICSSNMSCIFGSINYNGNVASVDLSSTGVKVEKVIEFINSNDDSVKVENYVVMPNHVHILLTVDDIELSDIVRRIKTFTQHDSDKKLWQRSYFDRKIRDDNEFKNHWMYIENNPAKWVDDKYYRRKM